jgi:hypothetical protein
LYDDIDDNEDGDSAYTVWLRDAVAAGLAGVEVSDVSVDLSREGDDETELAGWFKIRLTASSYAWRVYSGVARGPSTRTDDWRGGAERIDA